MSASTNLMSLPELQFAWTIVSDQDWVEGIGYTDSSSNPIALDGILIALTIRTAIGDPSVLFYATTSNGLLQILPASALSTVNSVWATAVFRAQFPKFLPPGAYVFGMQGIVGGITRNIATGTLIVMQGVS